MTRPPQVPRNTGRIHRVAVIGAGSWGTALALVLERNGHSVTLWSHEKEGVRSILETRENPIYLPGIPLPAALQVTSSLEEAVTGASLVVSVSPAQYVRAVMGEAAPFLEEEALVVSASKGIEISTRMRMDEVLQEVLLPPVSERLSVLSGPSFAGEVARRVPTAVVVASREEWIRSQVQSAFSSESFRVYTNPDVVGVELGGAVKNVIALAAGVVAGLGFGHNTLAALITRGLAEITRLGVALGADRETFSGLTGMGDLVLTCTGEMSRNRTVGTRLGRGERLEDILGEMKAVAEGVATAPAVWALALAHSVEMPIVEEVNAILEGVHTPAEAFRRLMLRVPRSEGEPADGG